MIRFSCIGAFSHLGKPQLDVGERAVMSALSTQPTSKCWKLDKNQITLFLL